MNSERINRWLFNDPRLPLLFTMAQTGGEVDTDPEFVPFRHSGPLRPLQQRLLPSPSIAITLIKCGKRGKVSSFVSVISLP